MRFHLKQFQMQPEQGAMDCGKSPRSVLDLFQHWVHEQPDCAAACSQSHEISYKQLDDVASQIACTLLQKGVLPGQFVPVLATRSIEMVACFLSVLKVGACYVPIDIEAWSANRITWTLDTVPCRVLINLGTDFYPKHDVLSRAEVAALFANPGYEQAMSQAIDDAQREILPDSMAYMIFTSGTTSTPKGVMIPHSALLHYVQQGNDEMPFNCNARPDDRILLIFSPGFDACVGVVFSALCNGAQLVISGADDLLDCARRSTILVATPSVLSALGEPTDTAENVHTIILGGEAPAPSMVKKWSAPGRSIYNAYGLTETTIMSLIGRIVPGERVTLGRTMAETRVILLDGNDAESDEYGEMCITGPGLALGYYNNEALTAERFIVWHGDRIFRTGDFARRTDEGLEFAGRADSLVKNRGFLVNLESQILPMLLAGGASTAAAFMFQKQLVAFVTPLQLDISALRQSLSGQYDDFMVPDRIRAVDTLPLTTNGKVDNKVLQQLLEAEDSQSGSHDEDTEDEENPGGNKMSKTQVLRAAIAAATTLPISQISEHRSFWDLGGNSLAAVRVMSYLRRHHLKIGFRALFDLPNLTAISAALQDELTLDDTETQREAATNVGPMSSLQSKMVQGSLKSPGLNYMVFHIHMPLHPGTLPDLDRLRGAWHQVLQRHGVFRTTFLLKEGQQEIHPELKLDWYAENTTADELDAVIRTRSLEIHERLIVSDDLGETFQPVNLLRLVSVPGVQTTMLFSVHHAQVDGWSLSIIFNEVQSALKHGATALGPTESPVSFIKIAQAQEKRQKDSKGIQFWAKTLLEDKSAFPRLELQQPPPNDVSVETDWISKATLPLEIDLASLEAAGRRLRVIPSALVYAAWGLVLSNYTFSDHVSFGAVLSGRNLSTQQVQDVESTVGPLINTVPFPIHFGDEKQTIAECLATIHKNLVDTIEYQWSATETMTIMTGEMISNAMQTIIATEYDVPPLDGTWTTGHQDLILEFGLSLLIERHDADRLKSTCLFDGTHFAYSSVRRMLVHFRNSLRGFIDPTNSYVQDVRRNLFDPYEVSALIQAPAFAKEPYDGPATLKLAFDAAAAKWPDELALESRQHGTMTYRELEKASNRLARQLSIHIRNTNRPREEVVVGVLTDRSLNWVVSTLAVVKTGAICCPLDITLPASRIQVIVKLSNISIFASANQHCGSFISQVLNDGGGPGAVVVDVDEFMVASQDFDAGPLETATQVEDVVYLVHTSGSTGIPKGVPLHNLSILHVIDVPEIRFFAVPGRRIAQAMSPGFDIAALELFGTLCYGGTLVLKDCDDPFAHIKRVHATNLTPSVLGVLLPEDYPELDMIALAGEAVPQSMADVWGAGHHLRNNYGPSECGPISTCTRLLPGKTVTIGECLPRLSVYVLDHRMCPVPQGIMGELYISGPQITPGYWKSTGQGQNRHVHNPFFSSSRPGMHQLMYRSGDLGILTENMEIRYMGRIDNQVKVRGFRIELDEVEQAIITRAELRVRVQNAAVVVVNRTSHLDQPEEKMIVAFVTPQDVDIAGLRSKIATVLPSYMRPSRIVALSELPKSSNSKTDRKALEAMAMEISAWSGTGEQGTGSNVLHHDSGKSELTATEKLISEIWTELLGLHAETSIPKDQDFLALGGNSVLTIKAARMIAASVGHSVSVALLVRNPILEVLAKKIDAQMVTLLPAENDTFSAYLSKLPAHEPRGADLESGPLSYLEDELFNSHNASEVKSAFNTTFQFIIRGPLVKQVFVEAFNNVLRGNPILRARYRQSTGEKTPSRVVSDELACPQVYVGKEWSLDQMQTCVDEPFDLASDQLVRLIIWNRCSIPVQADAAVTEVMLITHHIITDRASISLMVQFISQEYLRLVSTGQRSSHANRSAATYLDWAHWLNRCAKSPQSQSTLQQKLAFWKTHLRGAKPIPWPQVRRNSLHGVWAENHTCVGPSSGLVRHVTIAQPGPYNSSTAIPFAQRIAVAATALAIRAMFDTSDVLLALPYMNRDDPATAGMLGLFVDRIPLRLSITDRQLGSASELLDTIAAATHQAVENQVPYQQILAATQDDGLQDGASAMSRLDVLVIYNWQTDALERSIHLGRDLQISTMDSAIATKATGTMFPLVLNFSEQEDASIVLEIEADPHIIAPQVVDDLSAILPGIMQGLTRQTMPKSLMEFGKKTMTC